MSQFTIQTIYKHRHIIKWIKKFIMTIISLIKTGIIILINQVFAANSIHFYCPTPKYPTDISNSLISCIVVYLLSRLPDSIEKKKKLVQKD